MAKQICRVGDQVTGTCRAPVSGHPRTFTGTWSVGSAVVTADGLGVIRVDDMGTTDCGHQFKAIQGSSVATADGKAIVRVGDAVQVILGGEGVTTTGSPTSSTD